jgi:capsular polysaccharide export protein
MLQGPIGPFFHELSEALTGAGHKVTKINFSGGDAAFYPKAQDYVGSPANWPQYLLKVLSDRHITDVILFGDCRTYHEAAIETISEAGQGHRIWVFEEGYFRPHWITMDEYGANVRSSLPQTAPELVAEANRLEQIRSPGSIPMLPWVQKFLPSIIRYYGTHYIVGGRKFPLYEYHRPQEPLTEMAGWIRSYIAKTSAAFLGTVDASDQKRWLSIKGARKFVVGLQLESDFQMRKHSDVRSNKALITQIIKSYADNAASETYLIFKIHPFDHEWSTRLSEIKTIASRYGVEERVLSIVDMPPSELLSDCQGFIAINSTLALEALRKGVPTKLLGKALWNFAPLTKSYA